MTDLEMLKCTKKIKELLESGWNSEADEELGKIIDKLKVDLSMKKYSKASDRRALKLMEKLTSKKNSWTISNYLKIENEYMYWTDAYIAVQLKLDEAWVESLSVYSENDYPAVKTLFKNCEPSGDTVSLKLNISEVMFWKKTLEKEDGKQIVKTVCHDTEGNEFNCAFDVKNLEDLFIIMRADELILKAKKKTCAGNNIVNSFVTENEYGKGIVVSVRSFEGGEKNE